jgi:hypothetical protein
MTNTQPTLIDFKSIRTVNIIGITEEKLEEIFQCAYQGQYTKILYEDGKAIVTCCDHWTAVYFYLDHKSVYPDHKHDLDVAFHVEEGQLIDPATIPIYISDPVGPDEVVEPKDYAEPKDYDEPDEDDDRTMYEHPDLCQVCHRDYIDYRGRCEYCRDMHIGHYGSSRRRGIVF